MGTVSVELGELALEALAGERKPGAGLEARVSRALRFYLDDREVGRPAWPYPRFFGGQERSGVTHLTLTLDGELWAEMEAEAQRQGVAATQLAEHAVLYYAAELDAAGGPTAWLDELGDED